jgi:sarcosine oxidase, subunit gamma
MAEPASRRDPFDQLPAFAVRGRLKIDAAPAATRFSVRGDGAAASRVVAAFGLALPTAINTAAASDDRAALMIGPDEWLLVGPPDLDLSRFGAGEALSLVDVSHRNVGLLVEGALATDVLASGVMLDLDPKAFPIGMATRTLFVKAEIVLWRQAADRFRIELWRSFAPYFHGLLAEAVREYVRV